jgi:dTDP-glucose 4,6-dehydratase
MAEALVACAGIPATISRPFAFLGPGLPLDTHFAAGNFVADAVAGRAIRISGNGTPLRSYMHPADCAVWLLAIAANAPDGHAVNVGSPEPLSIADLARLTAQRAGSPAPVVLGDPSGVSDPSAYWPDTTAAQSLGLRLTHPLEDCIDQTLAWARERGPAGAPTP